MSIQVKHLTKIYGEQHALDDISFEAKKGEILGFLGPNGAGKSTTMKIITGYLPPSLGEVRVNGIDVSQDPIAVKKCVGYLPEHNPLYLEMYVREFLHFVGKLHGLNGKSLLSRVDVIIEMCGLIREQNKKIEALSKGYRQRVGLAQALLHDPDVLVLDEPTTGLDPNQIIEIRSLIKKISEAKTVIFSTHIMQEVQAICDRVIVIDKGVIVADDNIKNLQSDKMEVATFNIEFSDSVDIQILKSIDGVIAVIHTEGFNYKIKAEVAKDVRPVLFDFAAENNLKLLGLRQEEVTMESVFRELTKSKA